MAFEEGPFVQVACFCENVIEDRQGVLSLIKIIDTINHTASGSETPETMPPFVYPFWTVIMLKSGRARGRYNIKIKPEFPDGSSQNPIERSIHFDGEEKGSNLVIRMAFSFTMEGLYWFYVYLDDTKLTSMPLRVRYNRITSTIR